MRQIRAFTLLFLLLLAPAAALGNPAAPADTTQALVGDLEQTLEASLKAEEKNLKAYEDRLERANQERIYVAAAINGYQLQLSTFGNLLLSAGVELTVLQKTRADLKSSLVEIQKMTEGIAPGAGAIANEAANLAQQQDIIKRQIQELAGLRAKGKNETARALEKTARKLESVLKAKGELIAKLGKIHERHLTDLKDLETSFSELARRFDDAIEQRRATNLFERQDFRFDALKSLEEDGALLAHRFRGLFAPAFWRDSLKTLWQSAGLSALSIFVVLYGATALLIRIRSALLRGQARAEGMGQWTRLALLMAGNTVLPAGIAATLFIYSRQDALFLIAPLLNGGAILLLILLAVRWSDTAFAGPARNLAGDETTAPRLVRLIRALALFSVIYLPLVYVLGQESALLTAFRLGGALWLLIWTLLTWRHTRISPFKDLSREGEKK